MRTIITISWLVTIIGAFVLGYGWGLSERYDEVERVVLFEYNQQLKAAIREGMPFRIKGAEVSIYPREDGHINMAVARAGDSGN